MRFVVTRPIHNKMNFLMIVRIRLSYFIEKTANAVVIDVQKFVLFLSCLCGSEQNGARIPIMYPFLSCLCGSERVDSPVRVETSVSKLPVRQ